MLAQANFRPGNVADEERLKRREKQLITYSNSSNLPNLHFFLFLLVNEPLCFETSNSEKNDKKIHFKNIWYL